MSDEQTIRDLRAEVAALRRVIDGFNTRIAMSRISEEDMKMKIAKSVLQCVTTTAANVSPAMTPPPFPLHVTGWW